MNRVWNFLSDPGLHLLAIALMLIILAIGSSGSEEPRGNGVLVSCTKCRTRHYMDPADSCVEHVRISQARH